MLVDETRIKYDTPEWKDGYSPPNHRFPYLYTKGDYLKKDKALWELKSSFDKAPDDKFFMKGKVVGTSQDFETIIEEKECYIVEGEGIYEGKEMLELLDAIADDSFPKKTQFHNPLTIEWTLRQETGTGDVTHSVGESDNPIYVKLSDDNSQFFHTIVHVACSKDGAAKKRQAFANSWDVLKGPSNLLGFDQDAKQSRELHYYETFTSVTHCYELIKTGNGQCRAWAGLLINAVFLNGITDAKRAIAWPNFKPPYMAKSPLLLVKDWKAVSKTFPGEPFPYRLDSPQGSSAYGDLQSLDTIPGQNTQPPPKRCLTTISL